MTALLFLVDDLRERELREVVLRSVVENLHLFTVANQLRNAVERDVLAIPGVVELAVCVPLDHPNWLRLSHV